MSDGSERYVTPIHPNGDPQWHPTNPAVLRYLDGANRSVGSMRLYEVDVASGTTRTVVDLGARIRARFPGAVYMGDAAEGSPSRNGNRYAWMVFNDREDVIGYLSYDLASDRILGSMPIDARGEPDWISVTPSGDFVILSFARDDNDTFVSSTVAYSVDFTSPVQIHNDAEHSDTGINAAGEDVYIYIDFNDGAAKVFNLVTRERFSLFNLYSERTNTSIHMSGKGYNNPGWAVFSTYNCSAPGGWACHKVFAVELYQDNPRIANLAHTYNCGNNYWTETHAVTNRDLSRVYFNSDGGSCGIDAEVYSIDLDLPAARR